ncbi:CRP/FNR family transcriptional regulator [Xanthomonas sp. JAI131]|uniref:cyclic nucleotide-binding domain-containing protein n=1 Tax=Xanthomonas sp. JAI131 TaxID=2723067 RepID=UPI0015C89EA8|nr:cyclic nucleotide-binding domain-containing protein [Xanthomonas sp. JAI131]NYF20987.1 CRP/FNR family transcriptional regulator [Xanthomonas sp. JAI131]
MNARRDAASARATATPVASPPRHTSALHPPRSRRLPICPNRNGSAMRQCLICDVGALCLARGHEQRVHDMHLHVVHSGPYPAGACLFHEGDPMSALLVVRSGTVKLVVGAPSGEEQILGFAMPGDVIGLDAIHAERHGCSARVLEATSLCRLPLATVTRLTETVPGLQRNLLDLLSRHLDRSTRLLIGRYEADQRLAAFLMLLSQHAQRRGLSAQRLHLGMPRTDIANYLRLTPETVSRTFRRLQLRRLIDVSRRELQLLDLAALHQMGGALLPV